MKRVLLVTSLLSAHALAAGVFPAPGVTIGGPVDSNTVNAIGAANALSNAIRAGRVLTLEEFGAAGDGITDDTQAFVNATAAAASTANVQGARIALLHKRYYLAKGGTIPAGISVAGPGDPGNDGPGWDPTVILPLLLLGRGAGVTLAVNGNLANVGVARAGVNLAPAHIQDAMANLANYTGTGVTIGQAARVKNVITLGNALGYQVENAAQWHADTLRSDDLASIWIDNMHDVSSVRDFEAFPWLTARDGVQVTSATITGVAPNGSGNLRVTTSAAHGLVVGNPVTIWGVQGTLGANGRWTVLAVPDATHFDISASSTPTTTATTTTTSYNVTVASTVGLAYGQGVSGPGHPERRHHLGSATRYEHGRDIVDTYRGGEQRCPHLRAATLHVRRHRRPVWLGEAGRLHQSERLRSSDLRQRFLLRSRGRRPPHQYFRWWRRRLDDDEQFPGGGRRRVQSQLGRHPDRWKRLRLEDPPGR